MALSVGELAGFLDLNAGPFEQGIAKAMDALGSKKWQVAAATAGLAAGTALATGLLGAVSAEKANAKLAAQLDLNKEESAKAGQVAGALYSQNYGDSMEDVSTAVGAVMSSISGMRSASEKDVESITAKVLNLASAFEIDTGRAAQVAGQMITSGLATDANHAVDLLTGTLQKVPANVREDIMDAVDEYGPFMKTLGVVGEEAMGLLARGAEKGMYGIDKTGDALKEFTIRATDGSKATGLAMDAIGLNAKDMSDAILAGGPTAEKAFGQIINGLLSMKDPSERAQNAIALFGTPLEDLSVEQIPDFLNLIDPTADGFDSMAGAADEMGAKLAGGVTNNLQAFQRAAQGALQDTMQQALPYLNPVIEMLKQFAPIIAPAALALAGFAAVIGVVNGAMTAFTVIKKVVDMLKAWTVVQWALNVAMTANPIGIIIVAIAALVGALIWFFTQTELGQQIWSGFVSWMQSVIGGFMGWWNSVWGAISSFFSSVWNSLVAFVSAAWNAVVSWVTGAVNGFLAWWNGVWSGLQAFFGRVWSGIVSVLQGYWTIISTIFSTAWEIIQTIVATALAVLIAIFTGKWDQIGALFASAWDKISGFIRSAWDTISKTISGALTAVGRFIAQAWTNIINGVKGFGRNIVQFLSDAWKNVTTGVTGAWNGIVSWIQGIPQRILDGLAAIGRLHLQFGLWILSVKDAAVKKFGEVVGWIKGVPQMILNGLGNLGNLLVNAGNQIIEGFKRGLEGAFKGVQDFIGGIGQWIADHKGPKAYDMRLLIPNGRWVMKSLATGLTSGMRFVRGALGWITDEIASTAMPAITIGGSGSGGAGYFPPPSPSQGPPPIDASTNISGDVYTVDVDELNKKTETARRDALAVVLGVVG